jgi:hypothetical protein
MPDVTYEYNSYSSAPGWTNPGYAVDGQNGDEGVINKTDMGASNKMRLDENTSAGTNLGTITKVEFGVYGSYTWPENQLVGQFIGGSMFAVILSDGEYRWTDVSEELGGEVISDWSWSIVNTLDVDIWLWNPVGWENYMYIDQCYIRVTYDEPSGPANIAKVCDTLAANIAKVHSKTYSDLAKINSVA